MARASHRGGARPTCRRGTRVFVPADAGTSRSPRVPVGPAGLAVFDRRAPGAGGQHQSADCHRPAAGRARGDGGPCGLRSGRCAAADWRPIPRRSAGACRQCECRPQSRHPAGGRMARLRAHRLAACVPGHPGTARRRPRRALDRYFARLRRRRRAWTETVPCRAGCPVRLGADPWPDAPPDRLGFACPDRAPPQGSVRDRGGNRRQAPRRHEVRTHVAACGRRSGLRERMSAAPPWANAWPPPCAPPDPSNGRRGRGRQLLRPKGDAVHALAWQSP